MVTDSEHGEVPPLSGDEILKHREMMEERRAAMMLARWAWRLFLFVSALAVIVYNVVETMQSLQKTAALKIGAIVAAGLGLAGWVILSAATMRNHSAHAASAPRYQIISQYRHAQSADHAPSRGGRS